MSRYSIIRRILKPTINPMLSRNLLTSQATARNEPSAAAAAGEANVGGKAKTKEEYKPLYRRLSALGGAPEGSVSRTLNKWAREGRRVRVDELIRYVKDLRKYRRYKHALEILDWMVHTRGMNLSFSNHAIRIDLIAKVKGVDSAESYFHSLPQHARNAPIYGALLNCYCQEKILDKALSLYNDMEKLNLGSSTLVQNNLMSLYMKLEQPKKVITQFQSMKAKNIAPDNMTYCILMNSYAALHDIDSVERVVKELEEGDEVIVNWSVYSTLAAIFTSSGHFKKAESALKKLEGLIDSRNREPFHFLLTLYASTGNLAEVNRIWKSLKTTFPKPTNMSYLTMLQALNKLGDIEGMRNLFEEWNSVYVSYDVKLLNLMIGAYLRKDMLGEAQLLVELASKKGVLFDFRTSELFMDYHLNKHEIGLAFKFLKNATSTVKEDEWKLDDKKINVFQKYFEKAMDVEGAEDFCKILRKLNFLDSRAYESLLRTYLAAGKTEPSLRERIKEDNIQINSKAKKMLRRVC